MRYNPKSLPVVYVKVSLTTRFFRWMGRVLASMVNGVVSVPKNSKELYTEAKEDYKNKRSGK